MYLKWQLVNATVLFVVLATFRGAWAFWPATEIMCVESTCHVKDDWAFRPATEIMCTVGSAGCKQ